MDVAANECGCLRVGVEAPYRAWNTVKTQTGIAAWRIISRR